MPSSSFQKESARICVNLRMNRPHVAVNFALTWDGRISTRNWTPSDFSSPRDKQRLLELRATGDALIVGRTTLEKEAMQMGLPDEALRAKRVQRGMAPYPIRVLVSNSGELNPLLPLFGFDFSPVLLFSTSRMPLLTRAAFEGKATLHLATGNQVDLSSMLATLRADYAVRRLICEGGSTLFRSLLEANFVDEINLTFCPRVFGGGAAPTLTGCAGAFLPAPRECRLERLEVIGEEAFARYRVQRS
jgi:riboflavin-specific deaminase-like protein